MVDDFLMISMMFQFKTTFFISSISRKGTFLFLLSLIINNELLESTNIQILGILGNVKKGILIWIDRFFVVFSFLFHFSLWYEMYRAEGLNNVNINIVFFCSILLSSFSNCKKKWTLYIYSTLLLLIFQLWILGNVKKGILNWTVFVFHSLFIYFLTFCKNRHYKSNIKWFFKCAFSSSPLLLFYCFLCDVVILEHPPSCLVHHRLD